MPNCQQTLWNENIRFRVALDTNRETTDASYSTFAVNLRRRSLSRSAVTRFDQHAFSASWRQAAGPSLGSEVPAPPPGQTDDVDGCLSHKKCPKRLQFSHQMHILTIDAQS